MSIMVEYAMFPTDKGESVSQYVSRIIGMLKESGITYQLTPMGTVFETETMEEALNIIDKSYKLLEPDCNRVYSSVKFDIRKSEPGRMKKKIDSIEKITGEVSK